MRNFRKNQATKVTEAAQQEPADSTKVKTIRLSRKAGGIGGASLNTAALSAAAFGQEFIYELRKPLSDEEYEAVMK